MAMAASMATIHHHHHSHHQAPLFQTESTLSSSFSSGDLLRNFIGKRQLFLRSYQFSRKKSLADRIKASLFRFRRILHRRLRSAIRLRRVVWSRLRSALFRRRRRFARLARCAQHHRDGGGWMIRRGSGCSDSCYFW